MLTRLILSLGVTALTYGLCGGMLGGCSLLIDVDREQCSTSQDCEALGTAFAGAVCEQGVCVVAGSAGGDGAGGAPEVPGNPLVCDKPVPSKEPTVKYTFAPIFADGGAPKDPKPFSIKACRPLDLECTDPVFGPIDVMPGVPEDFLVPPPFNGYFEITNPDTLGGYLFMGRPIVEDTVGWNVTMPTPGLVAGFGIVTGERVDPDLGLIISVSRDCNQLPLPGTAFTNSKGGLQFYFVNNTPDTNLDESGPQGAVGFANVPVSTTTLSAVITSSGQELNKAIIRTKSRYVSLVELFP